MNASAKPHRFMSSQCTCDCWLEHTSERCGSRVLCVVCGQVHYDPLTSGLESESHFRVEEKQVIAGRYVVIQYLGSGTFCHTVQCEDLKGEGENRFVCVKISKNTKDILDQNLWEVCRGEQPARLPHTTARACILRPTVSTDRWY